MAGQKWTNEEIEFLKMNFDTMTCEEIAGKLKRTTRATQHMFGKLNLKRRQPQIGDKINFLTVTDIQLEVKWKDAKKSIAYCKCDCGNTTKLRLTDLKNERVKSCGCKKSELLSISHTGNKNSQFVHGTSSHRLYRIWAAMKTRCNNPNCPEYHNYGGRGIQVCSDWKNNFQAFLTWAINSGYGENLSIDRIDVDKGYSPENCRWATAKQQGNNRRNNININVTAFGETKSAKEWIRDSRCRVNTIYTLLYRIAVGWSPEIAITKPSERKNV